MIEHLGKVIKLEKKGRVSGGVVHPRDPGQGAGPGEGQHHGAAPQDRAAPLHQQEEQTGQVRNRVEGADRTG